MEKEIWKEVPGFNGMYLVSNKGRVLSKYRKKETYLKGDVDRDGYIKFVLQSAPKNKYLKIFAHRLVMLVFVGPSSLMVNHKNGIKNDNRLKNLEYCTPRENSYHAHNVIKTMWTPSGESHYASILTRSTVEKILYDPCSIIEAEEKYKYDRRNVYRIRTFKIWRRETINLFKTKGRFPSYKNSKIDTNMIISKHLSEQQ